MTTGSIASALKLLLPNYSPTTKSVSYSFSSSQPSYDNNVPINSYSKTPGGTPAVYYLQTLGFQSAGAQAYQDAMLAVKGSLGAVSGVALSAATSGIGDINITGLTQRLYHGPDEIGGFTIPANYGTAGQSYTQARSDIFVLPATYDNTFTPIRTLSHETQHALGLLDAVDVFHGGTEDTFQFTIMSYKPYMTLSDAKPTLPQLYDIAAIQALYGRNDQANAGNTTYSDFATAGGKDDLKTIWDGGNSASGGYDTIDASVTNTASYIDLRPGYFSSLGPQSTVNVSGGTTPSYTSLGKQNVAIAFGTYIENAKGSDANDLLVGNRLSNLIYGGAGNDIIYGDGTNYDHTTADYHLIDTSSTHLANPTGTIGTQVANEGAQKDILLGEAGSDYIYGSNGADQIYGGLGNDMLRSDQGTDLFHGGDQQAKAGNLVGDGSDTVDYSALTTLDPTKGIKIILGTTPASSTYNSNPDAAHASWVTDLGRDKSTDTLISIEKIVGTSADDIVAISSLDPARIANTDHLGGIDTISLGGQDKGDLIDLSKMTSAVKVDLSLAQPFISTVSDTTHGIHVIGAEQVIGSGYDDQIIGSSGNDVLVGGYGTNTISGGAGNDIIFNGNGGGTFDAGSGNDIFVGQGGIVTLGDGTDIVYKQKTTNGGLGGMYLMDHNTQDRIYWNGYLQAGTTKPFGWIDHEYYGGYLGWWDDHGIVYRWYSNDTTWHDQGLEIDFPNNPDDSTGANDYIRIPNFVNGDYGINIPDWDLYKYRGSFSSPETDNLPRSNISDDDMEGDWSNLTGWQESKSTPGGMAYPTPPTSSGPISVPANTARLASSQSAHPAMEDTSGNPSTRVGASGPDLLRLHSYLEHGDGLANHFSYAHASLT